MNTFLKSDKFSEWLFALKDAVAKASIIKRIRSTERDNFGDCKPVGGGVYEMRIHVGADYRVYYTRRDEVVYLLLCGGSKSTQQHDIALAIEMAKQIKESKQLPILHRLMPLIT